MFLLILFNSASDLVWNLACGLKTDKKLRILERRGTSRKKHTFPGLVLMVHPDCNRFPLSIEDCACYQLIRRGWELLIFQEESALILCPVISMK